jgi:pilus assembly protein TadC
LETFRQRIKGSVERLTEGTRKALIQLSSTKIVGFLISVTLNLFTMGIHYLKNVTDPEGNECFILLTGSKNMSFVGI